MLVRARWHPIHDLIRVNIFDRRCRPSGVILFALTLLVIGMVGLYATQPRPGGPRVIEYGDGQARYVLAGSEETRPAQPVGERARVLQRDAARAARLDGAAVRRHRVAPLQTRRA